MNNNEVLDLIIQLVKSHRNISNRGDSFLHSKYKEKDLYIWNTDYLLNQVIRQYNVSQDKYLISKKAKELWNQITDEPIANFYYREKVAAQFQGAVISEYKGAQKEPYRVRKLNKGDTFIYNDVFHHEHIIPVIVIIRELLSLNDDELDYEHVFQILEKIHICRMLKSEDKNIKNKYNRPSNIDEVLNTTYSGIEVIKP